MRAAEREDGLVEKDAAVVGVEAAETKRGTHSVQPDATSVSMRVCTKLPDGSPPECATRSVSTKPGAGACQSANVRIGTACRIGVVERPGGGRSSLDSERAPARGPARPAASARAARARGSECRSPVQTFAADALLGVHLRQQTLPGSSINAAMRAADLIVVDHGNLGNGSDRIDGRHLHEPVGTTRRPAVAARGVGAGGVLVSCCRVSRKPSWRPFS